MIMHDPRAAKAHFKKHDPVMEKLLDEHWNYALERSAAPRRDSSTYFEDLVESIVSQQLSVKAADTIWGRLVKLVGNITPESLLRLKHDELRAVGMSNAKTRYIHGLAEATKSGQVDFDKLDNLTDEQVIKELIALKGIGQWSAEMFLMFTLRRPDVFSAGDLGLIRSVETLYTQPGITQAELLELSSRWSPHRTLAALLLWRRRDASS
jgi:DNA-3-methyladenine glycosylase II